MSAPSAIAAVTQTLAGLLQTALQAEDPAYRVTTLPLDKSNAETQHVNRLNLFLIQPSHNAALRNTNAVYATAPGESAQPALAINLTYMITAYGEPTPETKDQRILGLAMQFLNDHPALRAEDIKNAFPGTGLENQFERVRITPRDLSLEEMSRMWSTFMTQYRTSAAYDVSVVLIDSSISVPAAPPILRRGEDDPGVLSEAGLPPVLAAASPPELIRRRGRVTYQPAIHLGQTLTLEGERLAPDNALLQVRGADWGQRSAAIGRLAPGERPGTLLATLVDPPPEIDPPPGSALAWAPGVYTAAHVVRTAGLPDMVSNAVPFAMAPLVEVSPTQAGPGDVTLTVACTPPPRLGQVVLLLLSRHDPITPSAVTPPAAPGQPATLMFAAKGLIPGEYLVRLRVDGVDSLPYRAVQAPDGSPRLEYEPSQTIVIA